MVPGPAWAEPHTKKLQREAIVWGGGPTRRSIGNDELQEAIERVIAGPERRSRLITPKEKEIVAYHEAGHAVAMHFLPNHDPVHKVTIVPRGMAGGYTMSLPDEETQLMTREKFDDQLVALLGGRVAEEIRFGDVTTGASNDLERVTQLARAMVTQWGMSETLGPLRYGEREEMVFLGRQYSEHRNYSDKIAQEIDSEVRKLVDNAHRRCHELLQQHWDKMVLLSERLLQVETVTAAEFQALMRGEPSGETAEKAVNAKHPVRESKIDEQTRSDKRGDSGVDLGGTVPAPA